MGEGSLSPDSNGGFASEKQAGDGGVTAGK